jgi:hypothetical protein
VAEYLITSPSRGALEANGGIVRSTRELPQRRKKLVFFCSHQEEKKKSSFISSFSHVK